MSGPVPPAQVRRLTGQLAHLDRATRSARGMEVRQIREGRLIAVIGCWASDRARAALQRRLERALGELRDDIPDRVLDQLAAELMPDELRSERAA